MSNEVTIHIKTNDAEARAGLKATEEEAKSSGGRSGKGFSANFKSAMKDLGESARSSLLPVLASLGTVAAGPLAGIAAGAGAFGALAIPELSKVRDALSKTGKAGQQAWKQLSPAEQGLGRDIKSFESTFHGVQAALQPVIDHVASLAVKLGKDLMPALKVLGGAGGKILEAFLKPLDQMAKSQVFQQFVAMLAKFGVEAAKVLGPALVTALESLMKVFIQMAPAGLVIVGVLAKLLDFLAPLTPLILGAVAAFKLVTIAVNAWKVAQALLDAELELNPIGLVITAVAALGFAIFELVKHWSTVWATIKRVLADAINWIEQHWRGIIEILTGPLGFAIVWIVDHFHSIVGVVSSVVGAIGRVFSGVINAIVAPVRFAVGVAEGLLHGLLDLIHFVSSAGNAPALHNTGTLGPQGVARIGKATGGIVGAAATGGNRSGMVMVGEHGRELVQLPTGSKVHSNPDTERMMGGSGGGGQVVISFDFGGAGSDELVKVLRNAIRIKGGNVQTVLGH